GDLLAGNKEEIIKKTVHPDDLDNVMDAFNNARRMCRDGFDYIVDFEYRILKQDGIHWIYQRNYPINPDNHRNPLYYIILSDITERKLAEQRVSERIRELKAVNKLSVRLTEAGPDKDIFPIIGNALKEITGAMAVAVSIFDTETNNLITKHIAIKSGLLKQAAKLLGDIPLGMKMKIDQAMYDRMMETVVNITDSLTETTFGKISPSVGELLKSALDIGYQAGIALQYNGELIGTVTCFMNKSDNPPTSDLLKIFANVAAVSIQRKKIFDELNASEERYRSLQDNVPAGVFRTTPDGNMLSANPAMLKMLGYVSIEELKPVKLNHVYVNPERRQEFIERLAVEESVTNFEIELRRRDSSTFWTSVNATAVKDKNGRIVHYDGIIEDITERREAEETIKAALKEKEVMLMEIHHRVKNNLQVISSLINLQIKHTRENNVRDILRESSDRIRTIALIHERLYRSADLARVNFIEYVDHLVKSLFHSYGANPRDIRSSINVDKVYLDIEKAIPCALIINELVGNSLKHAFPEGKGKVKIDLKQTSANMLKLTVSDNGTGLPVGFDINTSGTLGLDLVETLVSQLKGELSFSSEQGTTCTITFSSIHPKKRLSNEA
ncbi:PAS domain S-box protein, partial [candidate division WOR-3 bacterium]|nr:PAS domain S-box protein [candidate division WOR-3 bacterium]